MPRLSRELYRRCRATLMKCGEFDKGTSLRAIFVTHELGPFKDRLPEATSKKERVEVTLDYLLSKHLDDDRPVLPLFITALRDGYPEGDALRNELDKLASELHASFESGLHRKTDPVYQRTECQSSDLSAEKASASSKLKDLGIPDWVKQIPEPSLKELEEKLRMNEVFWQESSFRLPARNSSFAAVYLSQQASRLLELRDLIDELHASLQSTNLGSIQFHENAHTVLDQVLDQAAQITHLVAAVPQHPLGITTEKAISRVTEEAQSAKRALRRVAFETIDGPSIDPQLRSELTILLNMIAVSLDELQKYLQEVGHEAQTLFLSLN